MTHHTHNNNTDKIYLYFYSTCASSVFILWKRFARVLAAAFLLKACVFAFSRGHKTEDILRRPFLRPLWRSL
jgi:hypothetical protein